MSHRVFLSSGETSLTAFLEGFAAKSENILKKHADDKNVGGFVSEKENSSVLRQSRSDFFILKFFADWENKNGIKLTV